jgi:crotonobetainyl-CoA:carnitine CoA-transferase CaiB-like acyl-CoA transferase
MKTLPEVLEDPHFRARGMVTKDARGWDHLGVPVKFAGEPAQPNFDPPAHGQHSSEILRGLGYDERAIGKLVTDGVVNGS